MLESFIIRRDCCIRFGLLARCTPGFTGSLQGILSYLRYVQTAVYGNQLPVWHAVLASCSLLACIYTHSTNVNSSRHSHHDFSIAMRHACHYDASMRPFCFGPGATCCTLYMGSDASEHRIRFFILLKEIIEHAMDVADNLEYQSCGLLSMRAD